MKLNKRVERLEKVIKPYTMTVDEYLATLSEEEIDRRLDLMDQGIWVRYPSYVKESYDPYLSQLSDDELLEIINKFRKQQGLPPRLNWPEKYIIIDK